MVVMVMKERMMWRREDKRYDHLAFFVIQPNEGTTAGSSREGGVRRGEQSEGELLAAAAEEQEEEGQRWW